MFRPIDSCKPLVLSQDAEAEEEEKDRDTQETIEAKNGDATAAKNNNQSAAAAVQEADNRRRAKEEEANADSGDKKDQGTEKAGARESPEKTKQNIQP